MPSANKLNPGWLPENWTSKSAWLESAHRAARLLRQQVAQATPQQLRQVLEVAARLNPGPWGGDFHEVESDAWRGAEVTWKEHKEGTMVWVHGGAFAFGSPRVYRAAAVHLAKNTRCRILMPTYRLAPEHTYPAAHDDVGRALEAICAAFGEVVVVGDSAGGNLVLSALARLDERGSGNAVRAVALLSPWCDLRPNAKSVVQNAVAHSP
ncbi:MAG: alpha/beta hydrolase fold domain-containing protein, partial [Flavobacteriales bacterium]|nr:alpha/beta hydrolase fold domain-containing protein [Flavobacteriales bacterium]